MVSPPLNNRLGFSLRYGLTKFVLVAKHPCGIGVDRSIDCAVKLHESAGDKLVSLLVI